MPNTSPPEAGLSTCETLALGGRVRLVQPETGYRAGMDAALLAAAVPARGGERWLEAGCGVGAALLQAAVRAPGAAFTGLERDPAMAALARRNIEVNGLCSRCEILGGEVGEPFASLGLPPFDGVFSNPPFFDDPKALRPPAPAKTGAFLSREGLAAWVGFMLAGLREGGNFVMIHRADRLGDMLAALKGRAGAVEIRPVQPFADAPAKRVLVRARRGRRDPLQLLAPLVMHVRREAGEPVEATQAQALLRDGERLGWARPLDAEAG